MPFFKFSYIGLLLIVGFWWDRFTLMPVSAEPGFFFAYQIFNASSRNMTPRDVPILRSGQDLHRSHHPDSVSTSPPSSELLILFLFHSNNLIIKRFAVKAHYFHSLHIIIKPYKQWKFLAFNLILFQSLQL